MTTMKAITHRHTIPEAALKALKAGAETYESELEMDYLSRLSPMR